MLARSMSSTPPPRRSPRLRDLTDQDDPNLQSINNDFASSTPPPRRSPRLQQPTEQEDTTLENSDDDFEATIPRFFRKPNNKIKSTANRPPDTNDVGPDDDSFSLKDLYEEANARIEEEVPIKEANDNSNEEDAAIEEEEPIKPKLTKWKRKTCEDDENAKDPINRKKPILKFAMKKSSHPEHNSVSLKLKDEAIPIVEEDVFDVLGIPHGGARIILGSQEKHKARIDAWLSQFDTNHITVSMIADLMKNQPVSDNFKLNFPIVMSNVLIETPTHSYVERQLLRFDDSLDNCCNYNWAEYLINSLVLGTQSWNRNSSTFFTGPMIFLILFYVDRVRHKGIKLVDRRFPSYKGWTEKSLKERQRIEVIDGVFGIGSILPPLREVLSEDSQPLPNASPSKDNWDDWNHNKLANDWDKHINKSDRDKTNVDDVPQVDIMDTDEPNDENEDPAERLRKRAQNLIEEKMLFDTDLKIELDKDPQNYTLQTIATVIEDVFQSNCYHYPPTKPARQSTPPTREINNIDEDFDLTIQETDHIDLVDYIQSIQRTNESLQQQNRDLQFVPSFSLGIEDNIIHQVCQDINEQETTEPASCTYAH
ncbi:hypothetical protein DCAR_0101108 [Daucus carota subsp. sativus]|uniref:Uncharacterized protein n=1 Tax=Daucus carota subsp. sativus TaxID=79200 RepID=A0AAF0W235_DAUCS|nr:hypothetical protein DCAR_0101108 [Daucus carota subsp. sativus]